MIIQFRYQDEEFEREIEYVLDFLNNHPFLKENGHKIILEKGDKCIVYGRDNILPGDFFIPRQALIFTDNKIEPQSLVANKYIHGANKVYSVESLVVEDAVFERDGKLGFDFIETIFFHISRYEEYHAEKKDKDEWEMFGAEVHFLVRHKLEQTPVVDNLVKVLLGVLGITIEQRTRYSLSHDIDVLLKQSSLSDFVRSLAAAVKNQKGISYFKNQISAYRKKEDPYDVYDWLFSEEVFFDEKTVYFLVGGKTKHDRPVGIGSEYLKKVIKKARLKRYKIGLHPSFDSYDDTDIFKNERGILEGVLGDSIKESRQHFLRFDFKKTINILEQEEIAQDSSLGYQDRIGFRSGTGFCHRLWNFQDKRPTKFISLPMVVMDVHLERKTSQSEFWDFLKRNESNTKICFNFHNSTFDKTTEKGKEWRQFYFKLINQIKAS